MREEATQLIEKVASEYKDNLRLSFQNTICSYTCSVYVILKSFMNYVRPAMVEITTNYKQIIKENPSIIVHKNHPEYNGVIFYHLEDETIHCLDVNGDIFEKHHQLLDDITQRYNTEKKLCE